MPNTIVPAAAPGLPYPILRAGNSKAMRATRNEAAFRAWVDAPAPLPTVAELIEQEQTRSHMEAALARLIEEAGDA